jgi:hypothetical protein
VLELRPSFTLGRYKICKNIVLMQSVPMAISNYRAFQTNSECMELLVRFKAVQFGITLSITADMFSPFRVATRTTAG